ncbi:MAG: hypothetical protein ABSG26_00890 [Bryobacteraceae bacterium]|jgi:predicted type IV restriction endonuclease
MKTSDDAFAAYMKLKAEFCAFDLPGQTEADTRARVISRMLHEVLDWPHANVKREEYANPGFMDYVLLTNRPLVVIEAKKSGDTFRLPRDISVARAFTLGGVLRTVKNLQSYVDQVCGYCWRNGIEYAVITNGLQWVIFRAFTDGIQLGNSRTIVFNGFDDIEHRFVDFWTLLAKHQVDNNSIARAFQPFDSQLFQSERITDQVRSQKETVSRNLLSVDLEPLLTEYMGEIVTDPSGEKLRQLFVTSAPLKKVLETVEHRLSVSLSATLLDSGRVVEHAELSKVSAGIETRLRRHLALPPHGEVLLLLGRVGSGKTTFVHHFLRVDLKGLLKQHMFVPLDFRLLEPGSAVREFFYHHLHKALTGNTVYSSLTAPELRKVYAYEIKELTLGPLAVLQKQNKKRYEERIADFLLERYNEREQHLTRTIRHLSDKRGVRCVFLFDNVDQLDFQLQQEIFAFAHSISERCNAFSILSMWEETYFRSSRKGTLATYQRDAHTLPSVSVVEILSRRLEFIASQISQSGPARHLLTDESQVKDIVDFLTLVRASIMHQGRRVRFFLESLAMGNLRKAMEMFQQFMLSGHTDASKILSIAREQSYYTIPVHEFIKSIGLGDLRYYHSDLSPILNLYSISDEVRPSHFTKLRLLEFLFFNRNRTSTYGQGFVGVDSIEREFARIGTSSTDLTESLKALAAFSTVENELYDSGVIGRAYRITPAGRYYARDLAARFAYLDLMLEDTPIADPTLFANILNLVHRTDLEDRFTRVQTFLQYLIEEESREYTAILHTSNSLPLRRRISAAISRAFEEDKVFIQTRLKRRRGFAGSHTRTPYVTEVGPRT